MNQDKTKISRLFPYLPFLALLILLASTNPNSIPLPVILLPLILFALSVYLIIRQISIKLRPKAAAAGHKALASTLSAIITALFVLRSLGQLTLRDSLLFSLLAIVLTAYFNRLRGDG